jgi:peptidoglycan hydrolase-like protein with peptidoglycan-binding domain
MIKKFLILFVILLIIPMQTMLADNTDNIIIKEKESSDNVILLQLRLRDLGYFNYKITGYFGEFTKNALISFQKQNGLSADGVAGKKTLDIMYGNTAKRKPVTARIIITPTKPKSSKFKYGAYKDWFEYVNKRWPRLSSARVYDLDSGITYIVKRVGGHNHADVEPATKADCTKLLKTYSGDWDWGRRAVIITINGERIAGSINGKPHGYETISGNGMDGQVCIHFKNSRTHEHNMLDPDHQRQVKRAANIK